MKNEIKKGFGQTIGMVLAYVVLKSGVEFISGKKETTDKNKSDDSKK